MEARGKLRRLRQTRSILEYVKEFTTLMLEIDDMFDKDALFHFWDGLKDWARQNSTDGMCKISMMPLSP